MERFVRSIVLFAAVALAAPACGDDGGPTGNGDASAIRVTVNLDGDAEPGITVRLFATGGTTSLEEGATNTSGQVTFTELDPGSYEVEVVIPSGLELESGAARRGVTAQAGGTASLTFDLVTPLPPNIRVVTLQGTSFSPSATTISVGMTVRWVNGGAVTHTVTPDGHTQWSNQTLSGEGETFEHTFNSAGTYPYLCQLHAGMTGTITVN